jgi:hypothetical protein
VRNDVRGMAQRARNIDVLMKAPMLESKRRRLITVKNFFDMAEPHADACARGYNRPSSAYSSAGHVR